MPVFLKSIGMVGPTANGNPDRQYNAHFANVVNPAGSGNGNLVTVAISFAEPWPGGSTNYCVDVNPNQDCTVWSSAKTINGFNVTLQPRLATVTLASGTFDVTVEG